MIGLQQPFATSKPAAVTLLATLLRRDPPAGALIEELMLSSSSSTNFRGKLARVDLLEMLLRDRGVANPVPFDVGRRILGDLRALPDSEVVAWAQQAQQLASLPPDDFRQIVATAWLGHPVPTVDLPSLCPGDRVLELPGSGGTFGYWLCTGGGLHWADSLTVCCRDRRELTHAGILALESGVLSTSPLVEQDRLMVDSPATSATVSQQRYDLIIGLGKSWDADGLRRLLRPSGELVLQ